MKIDKQKLVKLLVNKTGMEKKEVEDQLDQLIERILDAAKKGKALEIKDFGLFYFDETEELKFEPSDELSTEISFKYAGMKPVEIQPDRDNAFTVDDESDVDDIFGISDEDDSPSNSFENEISNESDILPIDQENIHTSDQHDNEDDPDHAKTEKSDDDDFDFLTDTPDFKPPQKPAPKTTEKKEKDKTIPSKTGTKHTLKRRKNNTIIWLIAAVILIGLAGAAVFYLWMPHTAAPLQEQQVVVTPQAQPGTQDLTEIDVPNGITETEGTETETEQEPVPDIIVETEPVPIPETADDLAIPAGQDSYGLTGVFNPETENSYSIVLHSFTDENTARNAAQQLYLEGYRTTVTARTVSNDYMWRVSVGQFETLADAQLAANRLPAPYNTQHFIHRILNN